MDLRNIVDDAKKFIDKNPKEHTSSFNISEEEYKKLVNSDLLAGGYKVVRANLQIVQSFEGKDLTHKTVDIILAKADYNWLTGGYH